MRDPRPKLTIMIMMVMMVVMMIMIMVMMMIMIMMMVIMILRGGAIERGTGTKQRGIHGRSCSYIRG
jgi:hypothetical protein